MVELIFMVDLILMVELISMVDLPVTVEVAGTESRSTGSPPMCSRSAVSKVPSAGTVTDAPLRVNVTVDVTSWFTSLTVTG